MELSKQINSFEINFLSRSIPVKRFFPTIHQLGTKTELVYARNVTIPIPPIPIPFSIGDIGIGIGIGIDKNCGQNLVEQNPKEALFGKTTEILSSLIEGFRSPRVRIHQRFVQDLEKIS